ncbi:hypothetical protein [Neorhodopirellula pilleata]|uniref:Secreted protein n=1 Tax=Neorhodopirellula pilleata TaxID=2714738 RepID=A0A5C5ZUL8_9BACT|nr:hypothetical protein [Neorhodopirellula pilleata]TWT91244.1 hypothetical protein Pla100_54180 [Neorhodopirellula pilleata]
MKTKSLSLTLLFSLLTMTCFLGCEEPKATSVTEGLPASDIEAYEARVKEMEAAAMKEMEGSGE